MLKVRRWLTKAHCPHATSTPRLQRNTETCPFKMQHCPMLQWIHNAFTFSPVRHTVAYGLCSGSVCSLSVPQSGIKAGYTELSVLSNLLSPPRVIQEHLYHGCDFFFLPDDCPYDLSNNPIIQSNWKRSSRILHSDNARLRCPCVCSRGRESKKAKRMLEDLR